MAVVLGLDCKLYRGPAGTIPTELVEAVKDVTFDVSMDEADITSRKAKGWKQYAPTLKDADVSFTMNYDTEDEDYQAIMSAFINNTPLAFFISDDVGNGFVADFRVSRCNMNQTLTEAYGLDIGIRITDGQEPRFIFVNNP